MTADFPRAGFDDRAGRENQRIKIEAAGEQELLDLVFGFSRGLTSLTTTDEVLDRIIKAVLALRVAERVFIVLKQGDNLSIVRRSNPLNDL